MTDLAQLVLDEIAGNPAALARLRELVRQEAAPAGAPSSPAFTVRTLAAELDRTEGSIRAAIARGELAAIKRGRGYVISADAVAAWARAPARDVVEVRARTSTRPRRGDGPGPATRALRRE